MIREEVSNLLPSIRCMIREEVEGLLTRVILPHLPSSQVSVLSSTPRFVPHEVKSSSSRRLKLHFVDRSFPETLFTSTTTAEASEGKLLQVELCDNFGKRVEEGDESSAKVEIFVMPGDFEVEEDRDDWATQDLKSMDVKEREGKPQLLKGNRCICMSKGVAVFDDIQFTDNSSWMWNKKFKLGAQIKKALPSGVVIGAAVSEAFQVLENRNIANRKHEKPSLEDSLWRLENIGKGGKTEQRLLKENIYNVKDFLQLYHTDEKRLQDILHLSKKKWQETIKNAKSCELSKEGYKYWDEEKQVELVLDCVFKISRVTFKDQHSQLYEQLNDSSKELVNKLRMTAYENPSKLVRICVPSNQTISGQVESGFSPCNTHTNMHYPDASVYMMQNEQHKLHTQTNQVASMQAECAGLPSLVNTNIPQYQHPSIVEAHTSTNQVASMQAECAGLLSFVNTNILQYQHPSIVEAHMSTNQVASMQAECAGLPSLVNTNIPQYQYPSIVEEHMGDTTFESPTRIFTTYQFSDYDMDSL